MFMGSLSIGTPTGDKLSEVTCVSSAAEQRVNALCRRGARRAALPVCSVASPGTPVPFRLVLENERSMSMSSSTRADVQYHPVPPGSKATPWSINLPAIRLGDLLPRQSSHRGSRYRDHRSLRSTHPPRIPRYRQLEARRSQPAIRQVPQPRDRMHLA
jgi:hypothetical protein